ncbi:MAG: efflux RND transporter periplasmic adaptor subunit [Clostridia bacterium]|nr:efflux RND transporter periplasmic adaptor subunit [Clostridia bacterium]MDD4146042.1 efflux RND transporter periplasmic adaptor subunit [Clostridia bacterium]MDD4665779.1 efflux RND transporter periplasmic adaptor subunit [Clostridia bacterium]
MNLQIKKPKKKAVILGIAIIICILIFSYLFWLYLINKNLPVVQVAKVQKQELIAEIKTSGILQCTKQQDFYARTASMVKEIRKNEGSRVTLGEVVLLLDNSNVLRELGRAENALVILQNDYLQAVSNKVYLMNRRDEARKKQEWLEGLYKQETASLQEVEAVKGEVTALENQIKAINLNTLESQVNEGRLAVQAAREELAETVVTSPFEGTVLKMAVNRGEPVSKDKFLFSLGKTDFLEVVVFVNEYDAIKVKKDNLVEIYSDALEGKIYRGYVSQIAPLAEIKQTSIGLENKVKVKITLEERAEEFKPGFTVNVNIPLDKKPQALLVPSNAVLEEEGKSIVFVYDNGLAERREVQKGLSTDLFQEITAGLQEDEIVIIGPFEELRDKMKVKANGNTQKKGN